MLRRAGLESEKQGHRNNHRQGNANQTSDENLSPARGTEAIRPLRQITGALASWVPDTTQEWAKLAPLSRHLSATDGTPGIGLPVATGYGQLGTVLEPLLDQLGQPVELPVGAEEVLGTDTQQREPETARQLILLGVSLGLRPLAVLRTVELD